MKSKRFGLLLFLLAATALASLPAEEEPENPPSAESSESGDTVPEDLDAWKNERRTQLESMGFSERDLGIILEEEANILKETLLFPKEKRAAERERLTRDRVRKFISASMKFAAYPKEYIEKLVETWPEWFTNTKEKKLAYLQETLDAMEADEIAEREAKAKGLLNDVLRNIDMHYKEVGVQPGAKARGQFEASWERIVKTPKRLSKDVLIAEKTKIKRSGYDPAALKIIFEAVDALFS
ncbi:MAG: hypothetical protein AB7F75_00330 [Planctomycetota bacterium]